MTLMSIDGVVWQKSSFSSATDCVAVRRMNNLEVAICNTNNLGAGSLVIGREELADLLARIKGGEYDHLC
jgi:hypothetical protein